MNSVIPQVFLSDIDKERFGIQTARASLVTTQSLGSIMDFCRANDVRFLIARCDTNDIKTAQAMEANGFFLMDTLVYYKCDLRTPSGYIPSPEIIVRSIQLGEEDLVKAIAVESFRGYIDHYHADQKLVREKCDETYASWAYRSCILKEVADHVFVAVLKGSLAGFLSLKMITSKEGAFVLNGVRPDGQRSGIYSMLVSAGKEWCLHQGAECVTASTQLPNTTVQKVWTQQGFKLTHASYTFHKWFDEEITVIK